MYLRNLRTEIDSLPTVVKYLESHLSNKQLLDYILNQLYLGDELNTITYLSAEKVTISDCKNGDTFLLEVADNEITTFHTCWNNHHRKEIVIKYDGDIIAIRKDEATDIYYSISTLPYSTSRISKTYLFHNDRLFYKKEATSSTVSDLNTLKNSATVRETFINDNKEAFERVVSSSDQNVEKTTYFQIPLYETMSFSSFDIDSVLEIETKENTESSFNDFITQMKEKEASKVKSLNI